MVLKRSMFRIGVQIQNIAVAILIHTKIFHFSGTIFTIYQTVSKIINPKISFRLFRRKIAISPVCDGYNPSTVRGLQRSPWAKRTETILHRTAWKQDRFAPCPYLFQSDRFTKLYEFGANDQENKFCNP